MLRRTRAEQLGNMSNQESFLSPEQTCSGADRIPVTTSDLDAALGEGRMVSANALSQGLFDPGGQNLEARDQKNVT
jgi:hypothetical protein